MWNEIYNSFGQSLPTVQFQKLEIKFGSNEYLVVVGLVFEPCQKKSVSKQSVELPSWLQISIH